jgi:CRP-like cAMP-binding protein
MDRAIASLTKNGDLDSADQARLRALANLTECYGSGSEIRAPLGGSKRTAIIVSGWACEAGVLADGSRQIYSFLLPGDPIELSPEGTADRSVQALTRVDLIDLSHLLREETAQGRSSLHDTLSKALSKQQERLYAQVLRLGRLSAFQRVIDLLLELRDRTDDIGLVKDEAFRLPLTQENMADALGLSIVHINRTLQQLRREALLDVRSGSASFLKPRRLRELAGRTLVPEFPEPCAPEPRTAYEYR